jgi:hypothetical protein
MHFSVTFRQLEPLFILFFVIILRPRLYGLEMQAQPDLERRYFLYAYLQPCLATFPHHYTFGSNDNGRA